MDKNQKMTTTIDKYQKLLNVFNVLKEAAKTDLLSGRVY